MLLLFPPWFWFFPCWKRYSKDCSELLLLLVKAYSCCCLLKVTNNCCLLEVHLSPLLIKSKLYCLLVSGPWTTTSYQKSFFASQVLFVKNPLSLLAKSLFLLLLKVYYYNLSNAMLLVSFFNFLSTRMYLYLKKIYHTAPFQ